MKRGKTVTDQNEERINNLGYNAERGMEIVARSLELLARRGLTFPKSKSYCNLWTSEAASHSGY